MADWTDLSSVFLYGALLTSAQMQQLRDNVIAATEGSSGAPEIHFPTLPSLVYSVNSLGYFYPSNSASTWDSVVSCKIFIPDRENVTAISGAVFLRLADHDDARARIRIVVNSSESSVGSAAGDHEWRWVYPSSCDVSSYRGTWADFTIQAYSSGGDSWYEVLLLAYSFTF